MSTKTKITSRQLNVSAQLHHPNNISQLIFQCEPSQVIFLHHNLNTCLWIPFEEKLLVGGGQKGVVELFHLIHGRAIVDVSDEKAFSHGFCQLAINKAR